MVILPKGRVYITIYTEKWIRMTAYQQAGQWKQYEHQYRQAFAEAAKSRLILHGKRVKPIPAGALDGITRESVESGKKSVDIKI